MAHVDLDAARRAREEALGDDPPVLTLAGRDYKLRPAISIRAAEAWRANNAEDFVRRVLADPSEAADFLATEDLSWLDLNGVWDAYKTSSGESSAS